MSDTEQEAPAGSVPNSGQNISSTRDPSEAEMQERIFELKRNKRSGKSTVTKLRHSVERLCIIKQDEIDIKLLEKHVESLWELLEKIMTIMDELSDVYAKIGEEENKKSVVNEANTVEAEILQTIENAESVIRDAVKKRSEQPSETESPSSLQMPIQLSPTVTENNITSADNPSYHRLKPLKVPIFEGCWALFSSLVDEGGEPPNIKMARLRQSLKGTALDAIRGLGVSQPEYEEAKTILQAKFGGKRRQLHAYIDQLEGMSSLKSGDVQGFEQYSDLVRIAVVKLQAEGHDGELGKGTLHGMLVKKLGERQVESYNRWLRESKRERSVINLRDWLTEEVRVRVEAQEMVHGVERSGLRRNENSGGKPRYGERGKFQPFFACSGGKETKPPCALCEGNHGVWSCRKFESMDVQGRWSVAKSRRLCFRCLGSFHQGKACPRSKPCNINRCTKNHHTLLHDNHTLVKQPEVKHQPHPKESDGKNEVSSREGATDSRTNVTNGQVSETVSLRTIPVWLKANNRKVKINAILDDASNETFLNEDVAGLLGIREPLETIKVHVLNNEIETFQSMPVNVIIESVDGQFSKSIDVKTCPRKVTGNYQVEDWRESKKKWEHLAECNFPKRAEDKYVDLLIGVDNPELHFS